MIHYNPHMMIKVRSTHIMAAAKGAPCMLRVSSFFPGHNCSGNDTVVGAHLPVGGKGTSTKDTDLAVGFGCQHCHDIIDGRDWKRAEYITEKYPTAFAMRLLAGLVETHAYLVDEGLLVVPGSKVIR